ncbi:hypothetical protein GGD54_001016 [Rhizobium tropici]|uniref:Uncharacterized protein n=1 Tax=Rhizobium tropici TaxID=398 RepID=A0ABR6QTU8_RHITR|nr:hypothetical protein [Rhizobium tropici]MBB5591573.1 hypothetical protein [Rhizobium tropici]MBB6490343.1 hypothetical protein [Rhizobium tropici]
MLSSSTVALGWRCKMAAKRVTDIVIRYRQQ